MRKAVALFVSLAACLSLFTARAGWPDPLPPMTPRPQLAALDDYIKFRGHALAYYEAGYHVWKVSIEQVLLGSFPQYCTTVLHFAPVIVYEPPPSPLYPPCNKGDVDPTLAVGDFVEVYGFFPWPGQGGESKCAVNVCAHANYYIHKVSASPTPTRTRTPTPTRTRTPTPTFTATQAIHHLRLPLLYRGYHPAR